jgi:hypothetical protein
VERGQVGDLQADIGQRGVRRHQLDAARGARKDHAVGQLDPRDLDLEAALLVAQDDVARRAGLGRPPHAGQAGAELIEGDLAGAVLEEPDLAAQAVELGAREVEAAPAAAQADAEPIDPEVGLDLLIGHGASYRAGRRVGGRQRAPASA